MSIKDKIPGGLIVPALIGSGLLILAATSGQPDSFYLFERIVVCGVSVLLAITAYKPGQQTVWFWIVGFIAILFNPFIPVHLNRDTRQLVNLAVAVLLPLSAWKVCGLPSSGPR